MLSLIDELAGAGAEACGSGRPGVIPVDRSEDRDNHCCYEQHFITVTFGQNSICRCRTRPPLSVRHACTVKKTHTHTRTRVCMHNPPPLSTNGAWWFIVCILQWKPHQAEITVLLRILRKSRAWKAGEMHSGTLSSPHRGLEVSLWGFMRKLLATTLKTTDKWLRSSDAMFCMITFSPGIHMDVTLILNTVTDRAPSLWRPSHATETASKSRGTQ